MYGGFNQYQQLLMNALYFRIRRGIQGLRHDKISYICKNFLGTGCEPATEKLLKIQKAHQMNRIFRLGRVLNKTTSKTKGKWF